MPRFPAGVLIIHRSPFVAASIGRTAVITSSHTRAASSTSTNRRVPRTVASTSGNPRIRDPFGSTRESACTPSVFLTIPSFPKNRETFVKNSPLCRALGLTTTISDPGSTHARCTALLANAVDFPKLPRAQHQSTMHMPHELEQTVDVD